jgi:hypothetical protein
VAEFLREAGVADQAYSSDHASFASLYSSPDPGLRVFLQGFDRAYIFSTLADPLSADAIRRMIPCTCIVQQGLLTPLPASWRTSRRPMCSHEQCSSSRLSTAGARLTQTLRLFFLMV